MYTIALFATLGIGTVAQAADLLGTRTVNYGSETDVIVVGGPKTYRSVRICVHRHAVEFSDLDIIYGNGGHHDVAVRRVIPKGECTRWIDLKGPRRIVQKIVLRYDTWGNTGPRAMITARGK